MATVLKKAISTANKSLIGSKIPLANIFVWQNGPKQVSTMDLFKNKRVVVFGIPGAFTPTCEYKHVPSYNKYSQRFQELGVDFVACLSVNDPFVMEAFAKHTKADMAQIQMLSDANAEFVKAIGKTIDRTANGLGIRASRFSFYAENGEIKYFFEEPSNAKRGELLKTDAKTMIDAIVSKL